MINDKKLSFLFGSARSVPAPEPDVQFEGRVMRAISRSGTMEASSFFDQLAGLLPRIAIATALVMSLCVGADLYLSCFVQRDFSASIAELSQEWLFAAN
jgi:hypothetical protein